MSKPAAEKKPVTARNVELKLVPPDEGLETMNEKRLVANWEIDLDKILPPAGLDKIPLEELAKRINLGFGEVQSGIFDAREHTIKALYAAIKTGHYLNESKRQRPKGEWGTWREKHCPNLSRSTAHRYMDLAKNAENVSHVTHEDPIQSLRQAYLAVGLLSERSSSGKKGSDQTKEAKPADFLASVKSYRNFLLSFERRPLETMEPEILDQLSGELSELSAACVKLKEQIKIAKANPAKTSKKGASGASAKPSGQKKGKP